MSRENVEVVRSFYDAFINGDLSAWIATWHPEIEYRPVEEEGVIHGAEALLDYLQRWFEVWEDYRFEVEDYIDAGGNVVVVCFRHTGRGEGSGIQVEQRLFHVCTLDEGKLLRVDEYDNKGQALEAVGLRQ
jgi:ketosteroid isomerase-like protein